MLRDAQKCASVTEQAQRIGRPAAPAPHGLRRGMSSAYPCCSHDVRQRGYVRVLAWQPPNARRGLLDLAQEGPIPCESEACPAEKLISQRTTLSIFELDYFQLSRAAQASDKVAVKLANAEAQLYDPALPARRRSER